MYQIELLMRKLVLFLLTCPAFELQHDSLLTCLVSHVISYLDNFMTNSFLIAFIVNYLRHIWLIGSETQAATFMWRFLLLASKCI